MIKCPHLLRKYETTVSFLLYLKGFANLSLAWLNLGIFTVEPLGTLGYSLIHFILDATSTEKFS